MSCEILKNLRNTALKYNSKGAASRAKKAVAEKVDPITALDTLTEAIRQVGDGFGKGELFLP